MANISYDDIIEKDILDLVGLHNLPDDQKQAIYTKLYSIVENMAILRIDQMLSNQDVDQWKKLLEKGDRAASDQFLKDRKIDVAKILLEETALLKAKLVFLLDSPDLPKSPNQPKAAQGVA